MIKMDGCPGRTSSRLSVCIYGARCDFRVTDVDGSVTIELEEARPLIPRPAS